VVKGSLGEVQVAEEVGVHYFIVDLGSFYVLEHLMRRDSSTENHNIQFAIQLNRSVDHLPAARLVFHITSNIRYIFTAQVSAHLCGVL
jgi:hypothetical protein